MSSRTQESIHQTRMSIFTGLRSAVQNTAPYSASTRSLRETSAHWTMLRGLILGLEPSLKPRSGILLAVGGNSSMFSVRPRDSHTSAASDALTCDLFLGHRRERLTWRVCAMRS